MSSNVRNVVLRALFEPAFHNLLVSQPDEALKGYSLTADEADALKNPGPGLYKFLQPGTDARSHPQLLTAGPGPSPTPPPPTTVTVIVVVAITVFVAATTNTIGTSGVERYAPLIQAIHASSGPDRMDLVKTLVNELTKQQ